MGSSGTVRRVESHCGETRVVGRFYLMLRARPERGFKGRLASDSGSAEGLGVDDLVKSRGRGRHLVRTKVERGFRVFKGMRNTWYWQGTWKWA